MIIESLPARPLVLVGEGWQTVFEQFFRSFAPYIPERQRGYVHFARDVKKVRQGFVTCNS